MTDGAAACAVHSERASVSTCSRCGRFTCEACARSNPCLECEVRRRDATRPLPPILDLLIGITAVIYAVCTVLTVPAMAQIDMTTMKKADFFSTQMMLLMGLQTVYSVVWTLLAAFWLVWFVMLTDWARGQQVDVPTKPMAIAGWLVPGLNFIHPYLVLRKIAQATKVDVAVGLWWTSGWISIVVATVGLPGMIRGGYSTLLIIASVLELISLYLCWRIPWAFRKADQAWDPKAQLAQRG